MWKRQARNGNQGRAEPLDQPCYLYACVNQYPVHAHTNTYRCNTHVLDRPNIDWHPIKRKNFTKTINISIPYIVSHTFSTTFSISISTFNKSPIRHIISSRVYRNLVSSILYLEVLYCISYDLYCVSSVLYCISYITALFFNFSCIMPSRVMDAIFEFRCY